MRLHTVYRVFDAQGVCLYVGRTGNLIARRAAHKSQAIWWPYAHHFRLTGPLTKEVANRLEADEIRRLAPIFNGRNGWEEPGQGNYRALFISHWISDHRTGAETDDEIWSLVMLAEAAAEAEFGPAVRWDEARLANYLEALERAA